MNFISKSVSPDYYGGEGRGGDIRISDSPPVEIFKGREVLRKDMKHVKKVFLIKLEYITFLNRAESAISQANLLSRCLTDSQNHSKPNQGSGTPRASRSGQAAKSEHPAAGVVSWSRKL